MFDIRGEISQHGPVPIEVDGVSVDVNISIIDQNCFNSLIIGKKILAEIYPQILNSFW